MTRLVMNVMALVGACESKYALMGTTEYQGELNGDEEIVPGQEVKEEVKGIKGGKEQEKEKKEAREREDKKEETDPYVPGLKVKRAIEGGDQQLLRYLLKRLV